MKVKITNTGKDYAVIVRNLTKEQYYFLLEIAEELNAGVVYRTPKLDVTIVG